MHDRDYTGYTKVHSIMHPKPEPFWFSCPGLKTSIISIELNWTMGNTSRMASFLDVNSVTMVFNMATRYVLAQWNVFFDNSYKTQKDADQLVIEKWNQYVAEGTYLFNSRYGRAYIGYAKIHSTTYPKPEPPSPETLLQSQPSLLRMNNCCFKKYNACPEQENTLEWFHHFDFPVLVLKNNYKH